MQERNDVVFCETRNSFATKSTNYRAERRKAVEGGGYITTPQLVVWNRH
jgi:hypothetical protein